MEYKFYVNMDYFTIHDKTLDLFLDNYYLVGLQRDYRAMGFKVGLSGELTMHDPQRVGLAFRKHYRVVMNIEDDDYLMIKLLGQLPPKYPTAKEVIAVTDRYISGEIRNVPNQE